MARIEHFAVFASDLEAVKSFYTEAFGLVVIVDNSKAPIRGYFLKDEAGTVLEIVERPAGIGALDTRYVCHVAFLVDDYDEARSSLRGRGVQFEVGTGVDTPDFRTEFFADPDGNRCQIAWRQRPLGS